MDTFRGYTSEIPYKLCSLENNYLAVGYYRRIMAYSIAMSIRIINGDTGGLFRKLVGHTSNIFALVNIQNDTLASGSSDTTIKIWNWKRGVLLKNLSSHSNTVRDLVSLFDRKNLASSSADGTIKIWNVEQEAVVKTIENLSMRPLSSIISLNKGKFIVSTSSDSKIKSKIRISSQNSHRLGSFLYC
jgi:WD40 repeat protein